MIENVVGVHALPLGIALNFLVNDRDVLVPMAIEEPSVVAACSFAARLWSAKRSNSTPMAEWRSTEPLGRSMRVTVAIR